MRARLLLVGDKGPEWELDIEAAGRSAVFCAQFISFSAGAWIQPRFVPDKYRGILIEQNEDDGLIMVFKGKVEIAQDDKTETFIDKNLRFEHFLIHSGKNHIDPVLYKDLMLMTVPPKSDYDAYDFEGWSPKTKVDRTKTITYNKYKQEIDYTP